MENHDNGLPLWRISVVDPADTYLPAGQVAFRCSCSPPGKYYWLRGMIVHVSRHRSMGDFSMFSPHMSIRETTKGYLLRVAKGETAAAEYLTERAEKKAALKPDRNINTRHYLFRGAQMFIKEYLKYFVQLNPYRGDALDYGSLYPDTSFTPPAIQFDDGTVEFRDRNVCCISPESLHPDTVMRPRRWSGEEIRWFLNYFQDYLRDSGVTVPEWYVISSWPTVGEQLSRELKAVLYGTTTTVTGVNL